MSKFNVTIREARWHTVTFTTEADSRQEVSQNLWAHLENATDANDEEGDVLSSHGDTEITKIEEDDDE